MKKKLAGKSIVHYELTKSTHPTARRIRNNPLKEHQHNHEPEPINPRARSNRINQKTVNTPKQNPQ